MPHSPQIHLPAFALPPPGALLPHCRIAAVAPLVKRLVGENTDLGGELQGLVVAGGVPNGLVGCALRKGVEARAPFALAIAGEKADQQQET